MRNFTELAKYLLECARDFAPAADREKALSQITRYIEKSGAEKKPARLNFICTHNSRRSHFGQVMAQVLASYLGLKVETYSGGTEATAFHANAVRALVDLGVDIRQASDGDNPHYRVVTGKTVTEAFSKAYADAPNPRQGFAAIMVCSSADAACPFVAGAEIRVALPFEDPKISDGTGNEKQTYEQRAIQIGTELAWAFSRVKQSAGGEI